MIEYAQQSNILDFPPTTTVQGGNEWYTPPIYIEAARKVMGNIDLDPASCESANRTVKAKRYYTQRDNGLAQEWKGNVWLNPPFGLKNHMPNGQKSTIGEWVTYLVEQYQSEKVKQAIVLVTARTDARWFDYLWEHPICFTNHSLRFSVPHGCLNKSRLGWKTSGHNLGTIFAYFGSQEQKFIDIFSQFGATIPANVAKRVSTPRHTIATPSLWEVR